MVGNLPNYTKFDVIRCFLNLDSKVSRQELSKRLELGEGTVRTILDILKSRGLIISNNQGHLLTQKGIKLLAKIKSILEIKEVKLKLYPRLKSIALLTDSYKKISYEQRDLAVKYGAEGAIITQVKNKKLIVPDKSVISDFLMLEKEFALEEGNVMILAFSNTSRTSENAALIIASDMNKELNAMINENF